MGTGSTSSAGNSHRAATLNCYRGLTGRERKENGFRVRHDCPHGRHRLLAKALPMIVVFGS